MSRILKLAGIVLAVLILIVIAIPFLINANTFRPRLESDLTSALGRQVKVGNLTLSLFSGGMTADDISIADDPAFSNTAFVQAKSLKVGVEMMPLITSKVLNVTELTLDAPQINLVRSAKGDKWNFSSIGGKNASATQPAPASGASSNPNLSVAKLKISDGKLNISQAGSSTNPHVYDKVEIAVSKFSFTSAFPFTLTANLPAGGTLKLDGSAGPIDSTDAALTPFNAKVDVKDMNLASSGFIDPASGIAGIATFDGTVSSDGKEAKSNGTLDMAKLKVAEKGSPASRNVQLKFNLTHDLEKGTGRVEQGDVNMGGAIAHLTGTYNAHEKVTSVRMRLEGQGMPVDDLEAMLPAAGVTLPPKSQLKGGTLAVDFTMDGPVDRLVTVGSMKLQNSSLAGFSIGSELSALSALSGKGSSDPNTTIQNFSSNLRVDPSGTKADNINLVVPSIGTLTGAGTVSPSSALNFKMVAENIPFMVQGTTSSPKVIPDVKGIAGSLLNNALNGKSGQQNPLSGLTGLFGKKK